MKNKISNINIPKELKIKIRNHAGGSLYRMNIGSADCYAFTLTEDREDWVGGWDWSKKLVDKYAKYLYILKTNTFVVNKYGENNE